MKIGIANDHSAVDMKKQVVEYLVEKGYEVVNYGTDSYESCPYPKYGEKIGKAVADGEVDLGVAICGTGLGISMAANKVHGGKIPSGIYLSDSYHCNHRSDRNHNRYEVYKIRTFCICDRWK